mmetsp:Transcript_43267/g.136769  ORF Transcript_43267/g.136769 Transcript_43267/m.136769 type:complete len:652 (-) Transcript_43267:1469-3424(-)
MPFNPTGIRSLLQQTFHRLERCLLHRVCTIVHPQQQLFPHLLLKLQHVTLILRSYHHILSEITRQLACLGVLLLHHCAQSITHQLHRLLFEQNLRLLPRARHVSGFQRCLTEQGSLRSFIFHLLPLGLLLTLLLLSPFSARRLPRPQSHPEEGEEELLEELRREGEGRVLDDEVHEDNALKEEGGGGGGAGRGGAGKLHEADELSKEELEERLGDVLLVQLAVEDFEQGELVQAAQPGEPGHQGLEERGEVVGEEGADGGAGRARDRPQSLMAGELHAPPVPRVLVQLLRARREVGDLLLPEAPGLHLHRHHDLRHLPPRLLVQLLPARLSKLLRAANELRGQARVTRLGDRGAVEGGDHGRHVGHEPGGGATLAHGPQDFHSSATSVDVQVSLSSNRREQERHVDGGVDELPDGPRAQEDLAKQQPRLRVSLLHLCQGAEAALGEGLDHCPNVVGHPVLSVEDEVVQQLRCHAPRLGLPVVELPHQRRAQPPEVVPDHHARSQPRPPGEGRLVLAAPPPLRRVLLRRGLVPVLKEVSQLLLVSLVVLPLVLVRLPQPLHRLEGRHAERRARIAEPIEEVGEEPTLVVPAIVEPRHPVDEHGDEVLPDFGARVTCEEGEEVVAGLPLLGLHKFPLLPHSPGEELPDWNDVG